MVRISQSIVHCVGENRSVEEVYHCNECKLIFIIYQISKFVDIKVHEFVKFMRSSMPQNRRFRALQIE